MTSESPPKPLNNAQAVGHGLLDDFLAMGDVSPARSEPAPEVERTFTLAELDVRQVHEVVLVVPADEVAGRYSLSADVLATLRGELQAWLQAIRDKGQMLTELLSAAARDQNVRQMVQDLLTAAYNAPTKCWMAALPTGRQVIIAPSAVVESVGFEGVCRVAHERAIRVAQESGKPFNSQALAFYENSRPLEAA